MVNILAVITCILVVVVTVLILFIYFENVRERKEQQEKALELMERLQVKVFLLKADLTDFTDRNNLFQADFFYDFTFYDCIASITRVESKCTDPVLLYTLKTSKREKQIESILSDCKQWMLHIDRVSSSLETKSRNPAYNKELLLVA
jgi:hypothetical protein